MLGPCPHIAADPATVAALAGHDRRAVEQGLAVGISAVACVRAPARLFDQRRRTERPDAVGEVALPRTRLCGRAQR